MFTRDNFCGGPSSEAPPRTYPYRALRVRPDGEWPESAEAAFALSSSTKFLFLKRVEDLFLGLIFLLLASIPMMIVALAVKVSSPGPVLYRQRRYGLGGAIFEIIKFRTMTVCETDEQVRQCGAQDPRVTRAGRILRRFHFDELPNIFNVLCGDMSLVGPRPHPLAMDQEFALLMPDLSLRYLVKPGMTGLAQISGMRGAADTLGKIQKRLSFDITYISSWSLGLDLKIMAATAIMIAGGANEFHLFSKLTDTAAEKEYQYLQRCKSPASPAESIN